MKMRVSALFASAVVLFSVLVPVQASASAVTTASQIPALLTVAEASAPVRYDRDLFEHWVDADGDRCNTRYEVLIRDSTTPVSVTDNCTVTGGTWVSPYDGMQTSDLASIQIDHVVALSEAWRSGAWAWTNDQRRDFANDLGVDYALTPASGTSNQAKADKDPANWLPGNTAYQCEYVTSWALVKYRWSLTVDPAELAALENALSGECGATVIELPAVQISPLPTTDADVEPFADGLTRLAGSSRYDTAISVSEKYRPGVAAVFVATGTDFPDALSAAAAAAQLGGPLLLTPPNALSPAVEQEIRRLIPSEIFIAGDVGAVSRSVENTLSRIAPVHRLGGTSRYDTGNAIVREVFDSTAHAFIATGREFPDALAASGAAGANSAPVVLVDGKRTSLPAESLALLADLGVESVTIVGGTGAVSSAIETQLAARYATERIGGSSRYETAANINNAYFGRTTPTAAFLATGMNFPDALAGAALAGHLKSPVYVSAKTCVPEAVQASIAGMNAPATVVLGTENVVDANAAANLACLTAAVPTISGTARVGHTLTASPGSWTHGAAFGYQWYANGASLGGGNTLKLSGAHQGKTITVRVTGSLAGYVPVTVSSRPTSTIAAATPPAVTPPTPPAPSAPRYSGTVSPGAFCAKAYSGWIGYTVNGVKMKCTTTSSDSRLRWRNA